jgi:hypothetical protein
MHTYYNSKGNKVLINVPDDERSPALRKLKLKVPFETSPARAMSIYARLLTHRHSGKATVHQVVRMDNGDVVTFTHRYLGMTNLPMEEQRVAFFNRFGDCKWDMIA